MKNKDLIMNHEDPQQSVNLIGDIVEAMNMNKNGIINYSEFIAATIDLKKFLSLDKLHATFNFFDRDNTGCINAKNIKKALFYLNCGCLISESVSINNFKDEEVVNMIREVAPENEELDFTEFLKIMKGFIDNKLTS
jgi:calcium-dependent protein kinase